MAVDSTGLEVGGRCAGELIGFGQLLFFPLFSLFFSYFFPRTHARFFFSSRKPGEFGQYIKHTHARTAAVDRSCNQLSGELMVCSTVYTILCSKWVFFFQLPRGATHHVLWYRGGEGEFTHQDSTMEYKKNIYSVRILQ